MLIQLALLTAFQEHPEAVVNATDELEAAAATFAVPSTVLSRINCSDPRIPAAR